MTATAPDDVGRRTATYTYTPHPPQAAAHSVLVDELLYGGAAGGGKTDYLIAEVLATLLAVPGSSGVIFRRTFPDLARPSGIIRRLLDRLPDGRDGFRYNASEHQWTLPGGGILELGHLAADRDVTKYQGAEYTVIGWDQLEQFTEYQYRYLLHRLRAAGGIRQRLHAHGLRPRSLATANPGGVGHAWVKARFIDPAPPGRPWRPLPTLDEPHPGTRLYVPARLEDNPSLGPEYRHRLESLDPDTRRAMLDGDWDVYAGQRFRSFRRNIHVIDPEQLPLSLGGVPRGLGVDYGLDAPFAALWGARLTDGLIVIYRELYTAGLTPTEQAAAIAAAEAEGERSTGRPIPIALDPSTWARNPHHADANVTGRGTSAGRTTDPDAPPPGSIAAAYRERFGPALVKANNDRLAGVALIADKLRVRADGLPRLLIYSTCTNLIRTLPALPRDPRRPEDVDTTAEDHAYDALRYLADVLERSPAARRDAGARRRAGKPRHRPHGTAGRNVTGGLGNRPL